MDQQQLLAWLGMKSDARENAVEVKKDMEKNKQQLVEALAAKGEAMMEKGEQDQEKLLGLYTDIVKYTDQNDAKVRLRLDDFRMKIENEDYSHPGVQFYVETVPPARYAGQSIETGSEAAGGQADQGE